MTGSATRHLLGMLAALAACASCHSTEPEPQPGGKRADRCDLSRPFGQPRPVDLALGSLSCKIESLSQDELRMDLLCKPRKAGAVPDGPPLFVTRRARLADPWGPLERVGGPFPARMDAARISDDGRSILYGEVSDRVVPGGGRYPDGVRFVSTLWFATRADPLGPFEAPRHLDELSPEGSPTSFDIVAARSDLSAFYVSDAYSIEPEDHVRRATRLADGTWRFEDAAFGLTRQHHFLGAITSDELHAFFSAYEQPGAPWDVAFAARASTSDGFPEASRVADVAAVNTAFYDWPVWVSDDGCVLYTRTEDLGGPPSPDERVLPTHARAERPAMGAPDAPTICPDDDGNCGGCGRACATGSTCRAGTCVAEPAVLVAAGEIALGPESCLAVKNGVVYFTTDDAGPSTFRDPKVFAVPKSGSDRFPVGFGGRTRAIVPKDAIPSIADAGTDGVIWTENHLLQSHHPWPGSEQYGGALGSKDPIAIAMTPDVAYWAEVDGTVMRARRPYGASRQKVLDGRGEGHASSLVVVGGDVFVSDPLLGEIIRGPADGSAPAGMTAFSGSPGARGLATGDGVVYWAAPDAGRIVGSSGVVAEGQASPWMVARDRSATYWVNRTENGAVMKRADRGEIVTVASGQNMPTCVAVDETSVYWIDVGTGSVLRAAK